MKTTEQIYYKKIDGHDVRRLLDNWVSHHRGKYKQVGKIPLKGLMQTYKILMPNKTVRKFRIFDIDETWCMLWEVIERIEMADPHLAEYISGETNSEAVCIRYDINFNIWGVHEFINGDITKEQLLPTDYYQKANIEECDLDGYGNCTEFATQYNKIKQLPLFLVNEKSSIRESGHIHTVNCA